MILLPTTTRKDDKTGSVVSFNAALRQIISEDSGMTAFTDMEPGDLIRITGSASNDGERTVTESSLTVLTVLENLNDEPSGRSVTVEHSGRYGPPAEADGFYGFGDGLHTVSYHLDDYTGKVAVQGTLESDPGADDWFDIPGTAASYAVAESSDKGYNFTGNFVWIRASLTDFTSGSIIKILYRH